MPTTALASGLAAKRALEKVVPDMYDLARSQFGKRVKRWKTTAKIDSLYKKLKNIRTVKTILQPERAVDLLSFYYPSKVILGNQPKEISDLASLGYDGNILLQGTVGQGKSIFLRFLASRELLKGVGIPVFLELRRLKTGQSFVSSVLEELTCLGLEMDQQTFDFFAENGRITLFLDAFDEVNEEQRTSLIAEIENLIKKHDKLRVVITSRPDSGISSSAFFRVFNMAPLQPGEYEAVVTKLTNDDPTAASIISGIKGGKSNVAHLLTTPLMVALLVVRYRVDQSIPETAVAFYEALFTLLLQRHDKSKGGYVRPRKSGVGDSVLQDIFNAICFTTRKNGLSALTMQQLNTHAKEAIRIVGQPCDVDKVLDDIIHITCLILTEGDNCTFVHKSVQEYHSALFVSTHPDESALAFYQAVQSKWGLWQQELLFLESIDKLRFIKHFAIPQLQSILGIDGPVPNDWTPTRELILQIFGEDQFTFNRHTGFNSITIRSVGKWPVRDQSHYNPYHVSAKSLTDVCTSTLFAQPSEAPTAQFVVLSLKDLVTQFPVFEDILSNPSKLVTKMSDRLRNAQAYVKHAEDTKSVFQL